MNKFDLNYHTTSSVIPPEKEKSFHLRLSHDKLCDQFDLEKEILKIEFTLNHHKIKLCEIQSNRKKFKSKNQKRVQKL